MMVRMMDRNEKQSKVYLEIVEKIKEFIDRNNLQTGDKLPSERDLSERLQVGRSSVREALRSLELLGLIETKRGEGTFITDFRNHRLVEMLSSFILLNDQAKNDVPSTKQFIELHTITDLIEKKKTIGIDKWKNAEKIKDDDFFTELISNTDNQLLLKIWRILASFEKALKLPKLENTNQSYIHLVEAINSSQKEKSALIYKYELRKNNSLD